MAVHAFNLPQSGGTGRQISEFEASLVYRTASTAQRNSVLKKKRKKEEQEEEKEGEEEGGCLCIEKVPGLAYL